MVQQRIFYGAALLAALVALLAADAILSAPHAGTSPAAYALLGHGGLTAIGFALVTLAGTVELCGLARRAGHRPATFWCGLIVVLIMIGPWLSSPHAWATLERLDIGLELLVDAERLVPWVALLGLAAVMVFRQRTDGALGDLGVSVLAIFYIGYLGSFAVRLRCWRPEVDGAWIVLTTLIVVKVTDIGAYFSGLAYGKRPLIPKVSPKKTWEGLFGGVLASALVAVLLMVMLVPRLATGSLFSELTVSQAIVFGIVMSLVGQLGDLAESLLKRDSGAKDSAKLIPTFGGVLDLIDSPLLAVPTAYWLLRWWVAW